MVTRLVMTDRPCDPAFAPQDVHAGEVMTAGPAVSITEDRLTLTADDDGRELVYRADH